MKKSNELPKRDSRGRFMPKAARDGMKGSPVGGVFVVEEGPDDLDKFIMEMFDRVFQGESKDPGNEDRKRVLNKKELKERARLEEVHRKLRLQEQLRSMIDALHNIADGLEDYATALVQEEVCSGCVNGKGGSKCR